MLWLTARDQLEPQNIWRYRRGVALIDVVITGFDYTVLKIYIPSTQARTFARIRFNLVYSLPSHKPLILHHASKFRYSFVRSAWCWTVLDSVGQCWTVLDSVSVGQCSTMLASVSVVQCWTMLECWTMLDSVGQCWTMLERCSKTLLLVLLLLLL